MEPNDRPEPPPTPIEPTDPAPPTESPPAGADPWAPVAPPAIGPTAPPPPPQFVPPWATPPASPPPPQFAPPPPSGFGAPPPAAAPSFWVQDRTVEAGPVPGVAYAGFGVRSVAYLIDWIVLGFVSAIIWFGAVIVGVASVGGRLSPSATVTTITPDQVAAAATVALYLYAGLGLAWLVTALYFIVMWHSGGTIGMRMLGLRVACEEDGRPIGFGRATARYLGYLVDWLALGLGLLWVGVDDRKQGWHDKIAGTLVVRRV
jgi:uncharacterized RDD family membrane protein YckC